MRVYAQDSPLPQWVISPWYRRFVPKNCCCKHNQSHPKTLIHSLLIPNWAKHNSGGFHLNLVPTFKVPSSRVFGEFFLATVTTGCLLCLEFKSPTEILGNGMGRNHQSTLPFKISWMANALTKKKTKKTFGVFPFGALPMMSWPHTLICRFHLVWKVSVWSIMFLLYKNPTWILQRQVV